MKRIHLLFLTITVLTGYSCTKSATNQPTDKSVNAPSIHFKTTSLNLTSYTTSPSINLNGAHDITISGEAITGGTVPAISLSNCYNVHITQNALTNSTDVGIYLYHCYNITIDYNYIANVSTGVYVDHPTAGGTVVNNNQMLNMQGPAPRGQFVQFNTVIGTGNQIEYNKCENISGQSSTQEGVNLYMSNGTASSPIEVIGNWIRGGGPGNASGGIQLGDTGGSYESASGNILVNPGQMGLSVSGGDHISFTNNTIFSAAQSFTNVGIVVWGQAGYAVTNATVSGNQVNFTNSANVENDQWIGPGTSTPAGWSSNILGASINASVLPAVIISASASRTPIPIPSVAVTAAPSPQSAPIVMSGQSNVTISNMTIIGGSVPCIKLTNCTNVYITACNLENSTDVGIELDNCSNVTIEKNNIFNVAAGIIANNCPNGGINIFTNQMQNMQGPAHSGAFVQFANVNGSNNNISYNKLQNILGQSNPVNAIDIVNSNGTSGSPITLAANWVKGGGPNNSGGGIVLGHNGGSFQVASSNILVDPGQFGLAITGGSNISFTGNTVYAKTQSFTNVGIYVWGQSGIAVTNSVVSGNQVNFSNSSNVENDNWLAAGEATPTGWSSNTWGANINESVLPASIVSF
ncbi:parallel beta helix pectate lyase-like protein [Mucilaginibacter frigoritolerans]|uniref:Parallel beta helix pectate lyase-like protein n=1 Tax=Mucilaginibacter frigoritolerans TaxID=652788 RepID=A0A562U678_9SPHI|nr:right-handed parallel beta-helix repeat-containing protein [Mucilaginibacter frigoritolerans]TWJ00651.1 parallel beta helix pectate lyase-like protein [Mucilaginibacter frigoritolerans]